MARYYKEITGTPVFNLAHPFPRYHRSLPVLAEVARGPGGPDIEFPRMDIDGIEFRLGFLQSRPTRVRSLGPSLHIRVSILLRGPYIDKRGPQNCHADHEDQDTCLKVDYESSSNLLFSKNGIGQSQNI